jgi:hypothetical protein
VDEARLVTALTSLLSKELAEELAAHFLKLRRDLATRTLERASAGKFVETFVQCLQHMATGKHDAKPDVDVYLDKHAENAKLPDGLRICAARIARAIYTLRNKRNIAHRGGVDPNSHDLAFCHSAAGWIMAELVRNAQGLSMQEAGALIAQVQAPVGQLVEDVNGTRLIHAEGIRVELLLLLRSHYPEAVPQAAILDSLSRQNLGSVKTILRKLHGKKLAHGNAKDGYRLTLAGYAAAGAEGARLVS